MANYYELINRHIFNESLRAWNKQCEVKKNQIICEHNYPGSLIAGKVLLVRIFWGWLTFT